ncbi:chloramphenicol acetyltransferase [uncultured Tateyamaria sp.]|uniref:chloramphenicol acetyltransferase n=1 Tax=uncultured Tateyamaria sp. TaxID=455651 RepID=UPI002622462A|nr:chloramphenicol acetyltransferase [uncultured Tateyamaria sp.]
MQRLSIVPTLHDDVDAMNAIFGRYVEIGKGTRLAQVDLGDYSYCDRFCDLANVTVGKFSNIASFVRIGATDHPLDRASLHHFTYRSASYWDETKDDGAWFAHRASRRAFVGHDTWIGHNAQIKPKVTVGHGAVVASGAIVTRDVAPYTIVGGVTATKIRDRCTPKTADRMLDLAWWDWDHATLRARLADFRSLSAEAFLEKYEVF